MKLSGMILCSLLMAFSAKPAAALVANPADTTAQSVNDFSFKLYQEVAKTEGNIFISPYSVYTALGMTYAGASGDTGTEFETVLSVMQPRDFSLGLKMLNTSILREEKDRKKPEDYVLSVGNALWINPTFPAKKTYIDLMAKDYGAMAENTVDVPTINKWVAGRTNGKITDLLDEKSVDKDTMMILTNTVYFLGKWVSPFDPARTMDLDFQGFDKTSKTSFMSENEHLLYGENDDAQFLEMGYQGGDIAMMMILPKDKSAKAFAALEKSFDAKMLADAVSKLEGGMVSVTIPKFEMKLGGSILSQLESMGLKKATSNQAQFCGIVDGCNIFIAEVIHKAFIRVDEEGTEASAATAVEMAAGGPAPKVLGPFRADHPFLYLIRDQKTGAVLFVGRYVKPE